MRDVVPPQDRSIRNIPVPAHRSKRLAETPQESQMGDMRPPEDYLDEVAEPRERRNSLAMWVVAAVVLGVLLAVALSYFFAGATVTVHPKFESVEPGAAIVAKLDAPLGTLPYQTVTQSVTASRTVPTSGSAEVKRRASGTITVSNTYSTATQRLIKNTRFEAANGKIYRIDDSIVVPGATKNADGTLAAGNIDVEIFADSPGTEYNQGETTFVIPGFKGDPRYTKFTARSKTPLSGGFVGVEKVVSDADLKAARESIAAELATSLTEMIKKNLPEGFILIAGSERVSTEELPRAEDASGGAIISLRGTSSAAIVKEEDLASALLKGSSQDYAGEAVRFEDAHTVEVSSSERLSPELKNDLSVSLVKQTNVVWQFDGEALRSALAGAPAKNLQSILEGFKPAIMSATLSLRPLWSSTFPKDTEKIKLVIENPQ